MTKFDEERREQVSFDAYYFAKQKERGVSYSMSDAFVHIDSINLWGAAESVSGIGSTEPETGTLKRELVKLLRTYQVRTLLDAPCGDLAWLGSIELPVNKYYGVDIVDRLLAKHNVTYRNNANYEFITADISQDNLPKADLILCRDCLVHFSYSDICKTLNNFKDSGSRYLLMTTFTDCQENSDIVTGDWRPLNFQLKPFFFGEPKQVLVEDCPQNGGLYADKSLALWELGDLKV